MMLTQQWQHLDLAGNSFYILFPAKGVVSSSRLYVYLKGSDSLAD